MLGDMAKRYFLSLLNNISVLRMGGSYYDSPQSVCNGGYNMKLWHLILLESICVLLIIYLFLKLRKGIREEEENERLPENEE